MTQQNVRRVVVVPTCCPTATCLFDFKTAKPRCKSSHHTQLKSNTHHEQARFPHTYLCYSSCVSLQPQQLLPCAHIKQPHAPAVAACCQHGRLLRVEGKTADDACVGSAARGRKGATATKTTGESVHKKHRGMQLCERKTTTSHHQPATPTLTHHAHPHSLAPPIPYNTSTAAPTTHIIHQPGMLPSCFFRCVWMRRQSRPGRPTSNTRSALLYPASNSPPSGLKAMLKAAVTSSASS